MFTLKEKIGTPLSPIRNTFKIFMPKKFWTKILKKKKIIIENLKQKKKKRLKKYSVFPYYYVGFSSSSSYLSLLRISSYFSLFRRPLFLQPLHLLHLFLNVSVSPFSFGTLTWKWKSSQSRTKWHDFRAKRVEVKRRLKKIYINKLIMKD